MATYNWNSDLSSLHSYAEAHKYIIVKTLRSWYH